MHLSLCANILLNYNMLQSNITNMFNLLMTANIHAHTKVMVNIAEAGVGSGQSAPTKLA